MFRHIIHTVRPKCTVNPRRYMALWDKDTQMPCPPPPESEETLVSLKEATRFMTDAFKKVGTKEDYAMQMAQILVMADYKGHFSHGLNRLGMYILDIEEGAVEPNAEPVVLKESASTVCLCGQNGLGGVVGNIAMKLAISKAKSTGIGLVVARRSNHYGMASWYMDQALKEGLLGFTCSNTSPLVAPTGAKNKALGTNPMSFAAPGKNNDAFVMDMATTSVAVGKIELFMKKGEKIPLGWAVGPDGLPSTDSKIAFRKGSLMPLGGVEFGHKGYALSLMVESLCGILGDALYGPFIRKWNTREEEANLAHCFVCINPEFFPAGFKDRMSCLMDYLRKMPPADLKNPVQIPGDLERNNMKLADEQGGIMYKENQIKWADEFAKKYGIPPMKPKD
ncbi:uncharacterized oxidoreductase YjmC-like [Periplaneta americana]|uniref:uncharacterized oxidoreductase YjmC-like n=1 Tax=Periplaneta americana TaxID=6978 RepID=UPI0037E99E58